MPSLPLHRAARLLGAGLLAAALLPGCSREARDASPAPDTGGDAEHAGEPHAALPFIENDYAQALAEARQKKVPLFVELWAPW